MRFSGFPRGTVYTPVPNHVFGPLLEEIQDLAELKVTLRAFWLFNQKKSLPPPRFLSLQELISDRTLVLGLRSASNDPRKEIQRGLRLAVARQTFLTYYPKPGNAAEQLYFLNTETGRRDLERLQAAEGPGLADTVRAPTLEPFGEPELPDAKSNIFILYEENVGMVTPLLAEQLKEAEKTYPQEWVTEAFKIAASENKWRWRYISGILRRWANEGRDDGKPGRYTPKNNQTKKYLEEYRRRRGPLPWERQPPAVPPC